MAELNEMQVFDLFNAVRFSHTCNNACPTHWISPPHVIARARSTEDIVCAIVYMVKLWVRNQGF